MTARITTRCAVLVAAVLLASVPTAGSVLWADDPPPSPAVPSPPSPPAPPPPAPAAAPAPAAPSPPPASAPVAPAPGGTPPGAPPAAGAPRAAHECLEQIEEVYDAFEKEAIKAVKRKRYDATLGYVRMTPDAKDLEAARAALVTLSVDVEDWAHAVQHADEYLAAHPAGPHVVISRFAKSGALAKLERTAEARAAYETLTRSVTLAKDGKNVIVAAWSYYARFLAEVGDIEGSKTAWRGLKTAMGSSPDAASFARMADGEISALDQIGKEARAFPPDAKDLDGQPVSLSEWKGKVLLIDFWATWCGPCKAEMPRLLETYTRYHARGFDVVGVSMNGSNEGAQVRDLVASRGLPWRNVYFPSGRNPIGESYGVRGIPHTVLVGRDGKVVRIGISGKDLDLAIQKLLGP